jgi:undecaprenyl-diphosphatase
MALADARPGTRRRASTEAGAWDGLALGIAQALALVPGVSRNGATLTAARARGFSRGAASSLSWEVALPVMIGASVLKGARAVRAGTRRDARGLLVGAGGAFASTLASARWIGPRRGAQTPLLTFALYRCALVGAIVVRMRSQRPGWT